MLCPKCSREISSEHDSCEFCGFTFQTPKTTAFDTAPVFLPRAYEPAAAPVPPVQPVEAAAPAQPAPQMPQTPPAPAYTAPRPAYTAPYAQTSFQAPAYQQPYAPQAPAYQPAPAYVRPAPVPAQEDEGLSTAQYLGMMLLGLVPLVGYIFYIIWACCKKKPQRRRFAAAALILQSIGLVFLLGAGFIAMAYYTPLFFYIFR